MPERADSMGYGTSTRSPSVLPTGTASPVLAFANSHTPLRFCHLSRVSCGRGYSGRALFGPTLLVQGVASGGIPACQPVSALTCEVSGAGDTVSEAPGAETAGAAEKERRRAEA